MAGRCLLLEYDPDPNSNIRGAKDKYQLWENGRVRAETRFYKRSSTEINVGKAADRSLKQYETEVTEFQLEPETAEEYIDKVEKGLNSNYKEGNQVHVQVGESIGIDNIANISRNTEPISIEEVRKKLGEKSRDELDNPQAFHLE